MNLKNKSSHIFVLNVYTVIVKSRFRYALMQNSLRECVGDQIWKMYFDVPNANFIAGVVLQLNIYYEYHHENKSV